MSYDNLACGYENAFISGYIDHRGNVVEELDPGNQRNKQSFKKKELNLALL